MDNEKGSLQECAAEIFNLATKLMKADSNLTRDDATEMVFTLIEMGLVDKFND
jgi:hypothetical protein